MQQPLAARRQAQPTGVIETLSAGYSAVNHHLWVLLLPILLDVFLWFGPHVSYSPLVGPAVTHATEWTRQVALGPRRAPSNPELLNGLDASRQWLIERADACLYTAKRCGRNRVMCETDPEVAISASETRVA